MRVAVTGSSGLIGSALVAALGQDGHDVVRLVRRAPARSDEVRWDPSAGVIQAPGLSGVDAVVNLAGAGIAEHRWTPARKAEILDSRVRGTRLVAETMAKMDDGPRVLLNGSAIGWYGDTGDSPRTEDDPAGAGFLASVARQWEEAAGAAVDAGIRTVYLRTGIVLAAEGGALKQQLPLFRFGVGGRLGSGRQYQSWISIDDEVAAIMWCLTTDSLRGPANLTAPNPVTNAEFAKTLGRVLHRPAVVPVPGFGPKLVFGSELVDQVILSGQRVLPAVLVGSGFGFRHADLEEALRAVLDRPADD